MRDGGEYLPGTGEQPRVEDMPDEPVGEFRHDMHTHHSGAVASGLLHEAARIVAGARNATHGDKERSFNAIAEDWTAYLQSRREPNGPIRAHDVAHMMVRMKQQRAEWGEPVRDHWVDQCGYSAIAGELMGIK